MKNYLALLEDVLVNGTTKSDRTGTGTRSVFGRILRFDLSEGFPLVTTKKTHLRSIIHELLWFLKGDTNIKYLKENKVKIWDEWADENGDLGPVYGKQWADWVDTYVTHDTGHGIRHHLESKGYHFEGYMQKDDGKPPMCVYRRSTNQIQKVIDLLKNDPDSRRIYVSAINVGQLDQMALEPCHNYFQFTTTELTDRERYSICLTKMYGHHFSPGFNFEGKLNEEMVRDDFERLMRQHDAPTRRLNCFFLMRSSDTFLGLPFNIASYALLTQMIAQQVNMVPSELVYTGVDVHIYQNHLEQVKLQLTREPYTKPFMRIKKKDSIFDYTIDDFELLNYDHHDPIKAPVAI